MELFHLQLTIFALLLTIGAFSLTIWAFLVTVGGFCLQWESASNKHLKDCKQRSLTVSKQAPTYRHLRNCYLSNSKPFRDCNGTGDSEELNSNCFEDGNLGINGNEGVTADAKTVTVMVIKRIHPNF